MGLVHARAQVMAFAITLQGSMTALPEAFSCFQSERVVFLGDSTSRGDYLQVAHILQQTNLAALPINPLDSSVFRFIPPIGQDMRPVDAINRAYPAPSIGQQCVAYPTQSKWGIIMRYNHLLLKKHELCDCSPGPTLCCEHRFENHIFRTSKHGYLAHFCLQDEQQGLEGSLPLDDFVKTS